MAQLVSLVQGLSVVVEGGWSWGHLTGFSNVMFGSRAQKT